MQQIKKILIIRFSSMGDIVLTTPVIRSVEEQLRGVKVDYVCKHAYRDILVSNPHIHKVYSFKKHPKEVLSELRKISYDFVIDLQKNRKSIWLRWKLGTPSSGFNKLNLPKWLLVNFKINKMPKIHVVDRYFEAVSGLGVLNDGKGLDYFFPEGFNPKPIDGFSPDKVFTAIVMGGRHYTKVMPVSKMKHLIPQIKGQILLLGGPDDRERASELVRMNPEKVCNGCGSLGWNDSAWYVRQARQVLSHDTGFMHVAAAFHKKLGSIWGNTVPAFGMSPYFPVGFKPVSQQFEVNHLSCRPCSKIGFKKCPKKHFYCMNKQDLGAIANFLNE